GAHDHLLARRVAAGLPAPTGDDEGLVRPGDLDARDHERDQRQDQDNQTESGDGEGVVHGCSFWLMASGSRGLTVTRVDDATSMTTTSMPRAMVVAARQATLSGPLGRMSRASPIEVAVGGVTMWPMVPSSDRSRSALAWSVPWINEVSRT